MSGKVVGEVLDAADWLKSDRGLSARGFYALLAIADRCFADNRQASVPWSRIQASLYGASMSTAKRAVADLLAAGVIRKVRRGFDNHAGNACAPIYEINPLGERVTQVTQSPTAPTGHLGEPIAPERTGQIGERTGQIGERTGHLGDPLNGSTNGSTNGGVARATPAPADSRPQDDDPEPSRYCDAHPDDTGDKCGPCVGRRTRHDAWLAREPERQQRRKANATTAAADAIAACRRCDERGWLLDDDNTTNDNGIRCDHITA